MLTNGTARAFLSAALLLLLAPGCATPPARSFPEPSALPAMPGLPDPLVMLDGRRVASREQWFQERRPELKALFEHYLYGAIPPKPASLHARVTGEYPDFLGGQATLKLVSLDTGLPKARPIELMLVLPNARRPAPVFLAINFCGNQATTLDPRVPLPPGWMGKNCAGCINHAATEASRGSQATNWPLAEIVRRGYALATFWNGNIDSDRPDVSGGLYAWLAAGDPARNASTNRGTIAAWAWGFHRCVDYLVREPAVDPQRIAALGHSRNGKTALLAAAFDERIAIAFPHQAGTGGSAPSRSKVGESLTAINTHFPHWFNARFKQFNEAPEKLPFDQHCLVALCAPRPVFFSAAQEDQWANPAGQFAILRAADPVYRFLGVEGLGAREMPPVRQLVDSRLGYYIREGKHSMTADDWSAFMDFADRQWGAKP